MISSHEDTLRRVLPEFRRLLERSGYAGRAVATAGEAGLHDLRRVLRRLAQDPSCPGSGDPLIEILFLGRPVPEATAREALEGRLDDLVEVGLLELEDGSVRCDRYAVVPVDGAPFLVSRLMHARSRPGSIAVYLGLDTRELIDLGREAPARRVLDLGCGGGLVGIRLALDRPGLVVVGTDRCPEAAAAARANAILNGVDYEVREGDLYGSVPEGGFDLILADPPSLAVPDELAFPIYGDGGPAGDRLLRRIVAGAPARLAPGGRLVAITELQAAGSDLPFLDWLEGWTAEAPGRRARVEVRMLRRLPADYHAYMGGHVAFLPGGETAGSLAEAWTRWAEREGIHFGYWVHVHLRHAPGEPSGLEVEWLHPRPDEGVRPRARHSGRELAERLARYYEHPIEAFGPAFATFLALADGRRDLGEIAAELGPAASRRHVLALADALSQLGFLDLEPAAAAEAAR